MNQGGRADAHIHLFKRGYQGDSFMKRSGVSVDEVLCYQSLMQDHRIQSALVVGFAGESWCAENNCFLAELMPRCLWIHALAYWELKLDKDPFEQLEIWRVQGFKGISLYVFEELDSRSLSGISDKVWDWLEQKSWLISVNSKGNYWSLWKPVMEKHPGLKLIASHLGLPERQNREPSQKVALKLMSTLIELSEYPEVRVKLSGYYALTEPAHDFPHKFAWPLTEVLVHHFGTGRLLWGSDYSPCLDYLSFPQTFSLFEKMPFFSEEDMEQILGGNLLKLLEEVA